MNGDDLLSLHMSLIAGEPENYQRALNDDSDKCKLAMKEEYDSLVKNNTWEYKGQLVSELLTTNRCSKLN